ncbi:hypothetical protein [Novacetimonas pomaceti]|uniref:hypothetical protein n=1 Tax=Novacetimonas pomaceti TaxID=2021998 RepID=UPI001057DBFA|nr:hypothetical protein [Novacetimonas pomaceti]
MMLVRDKDSGSGSGIVTLSYCLDRHLRLCPVDGAGEWGATCPFAGISVQLPLLICHCHAGDESRGQSSFHDIAGLRRDAVAECAQWKNRPVLTEIPSPSAGYVITVSASFWFHNHSGLTDANGGPHAGHEYSPRLRGRGGVSTCLSSLPMNGQPRPPGMYRLSAAEWLILPGVICGFYDCLSAGRAVAS